MRTCQLPGWALLAFASLCCLLGLASAAETPMNVLVLYADDWRHDTLGVAGNPVVKTPQLDALAEQGMRFTQNCVTTSICGASRACLFTGQWISRNGCRGFNMFRTPWEETYPVLLRQNGYYVGHVGKWHNGKFPAKHFDFGRSYFGKHWYKTQDGKDIHVTQRNENDALVIFSTDNGYYHAEHGLADKWYPHQESIRVPLIIRDPRMAKKKHGTTNADFTLSVDLAPTILAAVGIPAPKRMQGRDMAPLYLSQNKPQWRKEFFYEHPCIRNAEFIPESEALVRKDWKYIYWPMQQVEQLFDLKKRPTRRE